MSEEAVEYFKYILEREKEIDEIFEKHDVVSLMDWIEKLDKRVSDIEEKMK